MLGPDHLPPPSIPGRISDLVDLESILELAILLLDPDVTELIIDEEGVVLAGRHVKIDDHYAHIAIDHQVAGAIPVKQAYTVPVTIVINIGPGKLAHTAMGWIVN